MVYMKFSAFSPFIKRYLYFKWHNLTQLKLNIQRQVSFPRRTLCGIPASILLADQTSRQDESSDSNARHDDRGKVNIPDPSTLSNESLIKQASVVTVESVSRLLTHCIIAYVEAEQEYQKVGHAVKYSIWHLMLSLHDLYVILV